MRIVLDTNVVLDWLVFRDPGVAHIASALEQRAVTALTNEACEQELIRVLNYDMLALDERARNAVLEIYQSFVHRSADGGSGAALPLCSDRDDQKFLELARDARAQYLITKDKALLKLARARYGIRAFSIVTPRGFSMASRAPELLLQSQ